MKIQNENGKSSEAAEEEMVSQQEVAKEKIQKLEEAMSLQQQQHLSSIETSKERLRSMEMELSGREKELNDIKVKCVQNEERLDESEKEIIRLRTERECYEGEMEDKLDL